MLSSTYGTYRTTSRIFSHEMGKEESSPSAVGDHCIEEAGTRKLLSEKGIQKWRLKIR
jgi:hypothetical protein